MAAALRALLGEKPMTEEVKIDDVPSSMSLSDVFDNDVDSVQQKEETREVEQEEEVEKGDKEQDKKPDVSEPPSDKENNDDKTSVPVAALKNERLKRQELEEKLKKAEAELATSKQRASDVPDPEKDPEGYNKFMQDENSREKLKLRIELSQDAMKDLHEDYDELEAAFITMANSDPSLLPKMNASKNPAKFAYDTALKAKQEKELAETSQRESLEKEIRNKLMAEFKEQGLISEPESEKSDKSALELPKFNTATSMTDSKSMIKPKELDDLFEE